MSQTLSDEFRPRARGPGDDRRCDVLRLLLHAAQPDAPTARHLLAGVERIELGRGAAGATRSADVLALRVPDPLMSTDHARLTRRHGDWVVEDRGSKNGVLVRGQPTRCAPVRPGDLFELGHTLFALDEQAAVGPADLRSDELRAARPELATFDPDLTRDLDALTRVAPADVPVLLCGETGTGKEVVARALHALSARRGAFVAVNCGGLAPQLVESELFGHRAGAFSGALHDRPGYVRSAHHGTLFLDEIGDLPLPAQAALLRVLQEREVVAVGDAAPIAVDFRLCAATHADLPALVAAGRFRADLHARLLGVTVALPPLRARRCDLGLLIGRLLVRDGAAIRLAPAAAYALLRHDWPLNVRELERALVAARALAGAGPIELEHLPAALAALGAAAAVDAPATAASPPDDEAAVREPLIDALTRHRGNLAAVARDLGKHREQIHRWLRRFGIDPDAFRP